jgi:hypothetical protein
MASLDGSAERVQLGEYPVGPIRVRYQPVVGFSGR